MRIKIDKADRAFSLYVRELADWKCEACGNPGESLQNSHYFGRANEATRFDPENCMCFCYACHVRYGSTNREGYRDLMIRKLGEAGFKRLVARSNATGKKDRKLAYLTAKTAYLDLCKRKRIKPRMV